VSRVLTILQGLLRPHDGDGTLLFWAKEILGALLIIALFWLISQLLVMALNRWGKKLTTFTATDLDDRILQRVVPHVSRLMNVLGIYLAIRSMPLHERLIIILSGVMFICLVAIIGSLIYHAVGELLKWYVTSRQETAGSDMSRQMVPVAEKIVSLLLMGTALIVILKHFNYDIFSLVTALGVGSLAVGMAAKETLAHMISGFTLMLDRPFRIGDRIQLTNGHVGDVQDIGLRSTKIRTLDNQLLIIPNSDLCNTMLTNQSFPDSRVKGKITVSVAYGSNVNRVKELLVRTALATEGCLPDPPPEAFFTQFGESALSMTLFFWVEENAKLLVITDSINSAILDIFKEEAVEIPYPTRTVNLHKGST